MARTLEEKALLRLGGEILAYNKEIQLGTLCPGLTYPLELSSADTQAFLGYRKFYVRTPVWPIPKSVEFWRHGLLSTPREGLPVFRDAKGSGWSSCGPFSPPYGAEEDLVALQGTGGVLLQTKSIQVLRASDMTPTEFELTAASGKAVDDPDPWCWVYHFSHYRDVGPG